MANLHHRDDLFVPYFSRSSRQVLHRRRNLVAHKPSLLLSTRSPRHNNRRLIHISVQINVVFRPRFSTNFKISSPICFASLLPSPLLVRPYKRCNTRDLTRIYWIVRLELDDVAEGYAVRSAVRNLVRNYREPSPTCCLAPRDT